MSQELNDLETVSNMIWWCPSIVVAAKSELGETSSNTCHCVNNMLGWEHVTDRNFSANPKWDKKGVCVCIDGIVADGGKSTLSM